MFFTHSASKSHPPGFSISETLAWNKLIKCGPCYYWHYKRTREERFYEELALNSFFTKIQRINLQIISWKYLPLIIVIKPLMNLKLTFSFFLSTLTGWSRLDPTIRHLSIFHSFTKTTLKSIRRLSNSVFQCQNPKRIKHLTQLRLIVSHLCNHKLKHSFLDTLKQAAKTKSDFMLHSRHFLAVFEISKAVFFWVRMNANFLWYYI